jgi:hypothetical protein
MKAHRRNAVQNLDQLAPNARANLTAALNLSQQRTQVFFVALQRSQSL